MYNNYNTRTHKDKTRDTFGTQVKVPLFHSVIANPKSSQSTPLP